jgi:hypothetical protein
MKSTGIAIKGVRLRDGKLVPTGRKLDASAAIRQRKSKKVKVVRRAP